MGSIHICTPSCAFDRDGDMYTCVVSGYEHACDATCKSISIGVAGKYCRLTQKCHAGASSPSERMRSPSISCRVNHKDRFFNNAKNVIASVSRVSLEDKLIDEIAMRCLVVFSELKDNIAAYAKIASIKYDYIVLALLYLFKDGLRVPSGAQIVPCVKEVQEILPNICEIHKCSYDSRKRISKRVQRNGVTKEIGVRKKTLTNTSRQVIEALRLVIN